MAVIGGEDADTKGEQRLQGQEGQKTEHVWSPAVTFCTDTQYNSLRRAREEEVSCSYLDLHFDLQVSPVDGEQCAVRARGVQLPGAVRHAPVAVSQEDQRGEGGDLAGEGALLCRGGRGGGLHFICTPTQTSLTHFVTCLL